MTGGVTHDPKSFRACQEGYYSILQQLTSNTVADMLEQSLYEASVLGRRLVEAEVPPEDAVSMHHEAVARFVRETGLPFSSVTNENLNRLLLELIMSYGLQFRLHLEQQIKERVSAGMEQVQRLESLGTMAAGVAHDFNTIIGSIIGFAELAKDEVPRNGLARNCLDQIDAACLRARDIVQNLLTFARQQKPEKPCVLALLPQIHEALSLLKVSTTTGLKYSLQVDEGLEQAMISCSPGQVHQVVMNLCLNAADAMEYRGEVMVRLEAVTACDVSLKQHTPAVCLSVADTGSGIAHEVLARIFDPFFTTKDPGKGSGLGLSVTHGIVSQLGGRITVTSRTSGTEQGTVFHVVFPVEIR